tara:strand:- start:129 stop:1163 length:1035 start_codon:yes stop_codon:yes gene_type:complete
MYDTYVKIISQEIEKKIEDWTFKSNNDYKGILEHIDYDTGLKYNFLCKMKYKEIFEKNEEDIISLIKQNDSIGKPNKNSYHFYNSNIVCSDTNLRYIFHSFLICEYINFLDLNEINIIEIGGGYGGLCFYLKNIAKIFNIKINSYNIFDLKEITKLQQLYLNKLNINNFNINTIDNFSELNKNSFLISNYAFSEIHIELQKEYREKIIEPYCKYGFLVWNMIEPYEFIKNCSICYEKEYPMTGYNNYYTRFFKNDIFNHYEYKKQLVYQNLQLNIIKSCENIDNIFQIIDIMGITFLKKEIDYLNYFIQDKIVNIKILGNALYKTYKMIEQEEEKKKKQNETEN